MNLKNANADDVKLLYELANDMEVRRMAFSSERIEWDAHVRWFSKKLKDPCSQIYIGTTENGTPIGQVRFDTIESDIAEIDVHVHSGLRGKGYGAQLIALGVSQFLEKSSVDTVRAVIKCENVKSIQAFEKSGFEKVQNTVIDGIECVCMNFVRKPCE